MTSMWAARGGDSFTGEQVRDILALACGYSGTLAELESEFRVGDCYENGTVFFQRLHDSGYQKTWVDLFGFVTTLDSVCGRDFVRWTGGNSYTTLRTFASAANAAAAFDVWRLESAAARERIRAGGEHTLTRGTRWFGHDCMGNSPHAVTVEGVCIADIYRDASERYYNPTTGARGTVAVSDDGALHFIPFKQISQVLAAKPAGNKSS